MDKVFAIVCQKGGVGKTTTAVHLGIGLARLGKKVLLIDADSQASLSASLGFADTGKFPETSGSIMYKIINEASFDPRKGILTHSEGVSLLPANSGLAAVEVSLASTDTLSREFILQEYINQVGMDYDYIVIDTQPSLGMLTINALAAANSVIIPVQPEYLAAKGLEQLLFTVYRIQRRINVTLKIGGILLTMVNGRANDAKGIISSINEAYGRQIHIYGSIPRSVIVPAVSRLGGSLYQHAPGSKEAQAYEAFAKEVFLSEK